MNAYQFFIPSMFLGLLLLGFGGLAGLHAWRIRQYHYWDEVERTGLRWLLEFSLAAVVFALLPFPLYLLLGDGSGAFVWGISSLLLSGFMGAMIARITYKSQRYQANWPLMVVSLLVLSAILLTIEVVNVFWWRALGVYAMGVFWILTLSGIQFVIFITYERHPIPQHHPIGTVTADNRVQRNDAANYPNGTANGYSHVHRNPFDYARRQRYADRYPFTRQD